MITQTERVEGSPRVFVSPDADLRALINTSPSLPNDLGAEGNIVSIETSLPHGSRFKTKDYDRAEAYGAIP